MRTILTRTDEYKCGHMEQYCPGTDLVYSYMMTRNSERLWDRVLFFGLQYYLKEYLAQPITHAMGDRFVRNQEHIIGSVSKNVKKKIYDLCDLGYWPLKIKAVAEGTILPIRNVVLTNVNTIPDFYWCVGFLESLLLKIWYPCNVATLCHKYRKLVHKYCRKTGTTMGLEPFMVHDFGYRSDATEIGAEISGAAHLTNFLGSDTVPALDFLIDYYNADISKPIMKSVPASEHSVMCSFGKEDELAAFEHMLDLYPVGIVSIVSDTYDVYKVLNEFTLRLKDKILSRNGKVVFRPDSGDPFLIITGDPDATYGSPQWEGAIRILDRIFKHTINEKGFKVLSPKVGLIYGDSMFYERYEKTLAKMAEMGYAAENLIIGAGGILRTHTRDSLGFALKATYVTVNGEPREIEKDPITDHSKKSHKGMMCLLKDSKGNFYTKDQVSPEEENTGFLETVFLDGKITKEYSLDEIRQKVENYLNENN